MTEATDQPITFEARRAAARLHGALKVLVSMHIALVRVTLPKMLCQKADISPSTRPGDWCSVVAELPSEHADVP